MEQKNIRTNSKAIYLKKKKKELTKGYSWLHITILWGGFKKIITLKNRCFISLH